MSQFEKQAEVMPPIYGQVAAINMNANTAVVVDFCSFPRSAAEPGERPTKNAVATMIRITADGGPVYYVTGANFAAVANATIAARTAVNGSTGAVTFGNGTLDKIPTDTYKDFKVMPGGTPSASGVVPGSDSPCRYCALVGTSPAVARLYQRSR